MKKVLSAILAAALLLALSPPAFAGSLSAADAAPVGTEPVISSAGLDANVPTEKDEVVYGILNADGSANSVYVVNDFDPVSGTITDYGDYSGRAQPDHGRSYRCQRRSDND